MKKKGRIWRTRSAEKRERKGLRKKGKQFAQKAATGGFVRGKSVA